MPFPQRPTASLTTWWTLGVVSCARRTDPAEFLFVDTDGLHCCAVSCDDELHCSAVHTAPSLGSCRVSVARQSHCICRATTHFSFTSVPRASKGPASIERTAHNTTPLKCLIITLGHTGEGERRKPGARLARASRISNRDRNQFAPLGDRPCERAIDGLRARTLESPCVWDGMALEFQDVRQV